MSPSAARLAAMRARMPPAVLVSILLLFVLLAAVKQRFLLSRSLTALYTAANALLKCIIRKAEIVRRNEKESRLICSLFYFFQNIEKSAPRRIILWRGASVICHREAVSVSSSDTV